MVKIFRVLLFSASVHSELLLSSLLDGSTTLFMKCMPTPSLSGIEFLCRAACVGVAEQTYYLPKKGRSNPAGKLYSRINYIKQSERDRDRKETQHLSLESDNAVDTISPEAINALSWLELNKSPWATVLIQWETSFPARKAELRQFNKADRIINTFHHLSEKFGHQLLDIDYRLLELGNPTEPLKKWNDIFESIVTYLEKYARDPSSKVLTNAIRNSELSTDSRLLNLLLALNTVLIPVKAARGFKPTVATAQEDTFVLAKNKDEASTVIRNSQSVYDEEGLSRCPKLIVLGDSITNATGQCIVVYKNLEYNLKSIARGVDVLMKLHLVLDIPISKLSKLVWVFIATYLYGTESKHGGYLCVNRLIDHLNSHKQ